MSKPQPIEYAKAPPKVRAVFDDIKKSRNVPDVNNFWKYLARDPALLERTWKNLKAVMAPGALDPLTKELMYVAVSVTNGCAYCIASHTAAAQKAGMSPAMFAELMAVVGMANTTNRLANGYQVPIDDRFRPPAPKGGNDSEPSVAPRASRTHRRQPQRPARAAGAAADGREAMQPRVAGSVKRATTSGATPRAAGPSTRRRRLR